MYPSMASNPSTPPLLIFTSAKMFAKNCQYPHNAPFPVLYDGQMYAKGSASGFGHWRCSAPEFVWGQGRADRESATVSKVGLGHN